jgi:hypothetical protein
MIYAGRHEESEELVGIATESLDDGVVVLHCAKGRYGGVRPALPRDQLAAGSLEVRQVRISGIGQLTHRGELRWIRVEVKRQGIVLRTEQEKPINDLIDLEGISIKIPTNVRISGVRNWQWSKIWGALERR